MPLKAKPKGQKLSLRAFLDSESSTANTTTDNAANFNPKPNLKRAVAGSWHQVDRGEVTVPDTERDQVMASNGNDQSDVPTHNQSNPTLRDQDSPIRNSGSVGHESADNVGAPVATEDDSSEAPYDTEELEDDDLEHDSYEDGEIELTHRQRPKPEYQGFFGTVKTSQRKQK